MAEVLIVDDEIGVRALLSEILNGQGHSVIEAESADMARKYVIRSRPDIVLLDAWMPEVDGMALLKEWSSSGYLTSMPVIMMGGHTSVAISTKVLKLGAKCFLEKPITLNKLNSAINQHLGNMIRAKLPNPKEDLIIKMTSPMQEEKIPQSKPFDPSLMEFCLDRPFKEFKDEFEREYFSFHLKKGKYSITEMSEATGIERTHLYRKLKQLGFDLSSIPEKKKLYMGSGTKKTEAKQELSAEASA